MGAVRDGSMVRVWLWMVMLLGTGRLALKWGRVDLLFRGKEVWNIFGVFR